MREDFTIMVVDWQTHATQLRLVREQVFILEQQVPVAMEWDGLDAAAQHLLALDVSEQAIGCARVLVDSSIGRMAVLQPWRGQGVGHALLNKAIELCQLQNTQAVTLSAQMHAISFYERSGFEVCSEPYLDANILHVDMRLP